MRQRPIPLSPSSCPVAHAVSHRLWCPDPSEPALVQWWQPLVAYARRARVDDIPWVIYIEDFDVIGCVRRDAHADLWIYRHHASPHELVVDAKGQPYKFIPSSGRQAGRFAATEVRTALWRAGLPDVLDAFESPAPPWVVEGDDPWSKDDYFGVASGVPGS